MFKKVLSLLLVLVMAASLCVAMASCNKNENGEDGLSASPLPEVELKKDFEVDENFKVGFILLHDEASTYDKNFLDAATRVKETLGLTDEQVILKKNVAESNACYEAAADLVDEGCKVIFANSFGHETHLIKAAKEFTNVQFCHATGTMAHTEGLSNYHNAFASIYQGRYLAGVAAGLKLNEMIKDGKITADKAKMGYVGAFTYAEVISGYTSFYLGAKSVCPSVTMEVQFTGSWYDEIKEKEAASALIENGCVLISQHADSMGAPSVCEEKGVPNISYNGSTFVSCPETFIVSSKIDWAPYYMYITKCYVNGEDIATDWCGGIKEGSVVLTGINLDVAAEGTVDAINTAIEGLKAGTIHVFDIEKFTVNNGAKLEKAFATDTNGDFVNDKDEAVIDGYYHESYFQSAPSFAIDIDGITRLN